MYSSVNLFITRTIPFKYLNLLLKRAIAYKIFVKTAQIDEQILGKQVPGTASMSYKITKA